MTDFDSTLTVWQVASEAHQDLWMFYIVVVSGALGFSFSSSFNRAGHARWALFTLVLLFMVSNVISLWNNLEVYNAAVKLLIESGRISQVLKEIEHIPEQLIFWLHVALDAFVLTILGNRACAPKAV